MTAEQRRLSAQRVGNRLGIRPELVDRRERSRRVENRGHQLVRRIEERINNDLVVYPQVQRDSEHRGENRDPLRAIQKRLFDTSRQLQVPPDHDVDRRQRDRSRLDRRCDPGEVLGHRLQQLRVEPGQKRFEEAHGRLFLRPGRRICPNGRSISRGVG